MRTIVLANHTTERPDITPAWLHRAANTLGIQLQRHVYPAWAAWGFGPWCVVPEGSKGAHADAPRLAIFDHEDAPGALGYHDVGPNRAPFGKAFASVDGQAQSLDALTVTLSHEAIELPGNPAADLFVRAPSGVEYARELCDAVEDVTYSIEGVQVSDFLLPGWFGEGPDSAYDFRRVLTAPWTRTAGGYVIWGADAGAITTDPPETMVRKAHEVSRFSKIVRASDRALLEKVRATDDGTYPNARTWTPAT